MLSVFTTTISTSVGARVARLFFIVSLVMGGSWLTAASKDAEFMTELRQLRNIEGITLQEGGSLKEDGNVVSQTQLVVRERHGLLRPIFAGLGALFFTAVTIAGLRSGEGVPVLLTIPFAVLSGLECMWSFANYMNPPVMCSLSDNYFSRHGVSTPWSQVGECSVWEREIDHGSTIYHPKDSSWGTTIPHKSHVKMLSLNGKYGASLMEVSSDIMPIRAKRLQAVINTFKSLAAAK